MIQMIEGFSEPEKLEKVLHRTAVDAEDLLQKVEEILENVRLGGDRELLRYTHLYDGHILNDLKVSEHEIEEAKARIDADLKRAIGRAIDNITKYHRRQLDSGFIMEEKNGVILGQVIRPIEKVGVYIPGGTASYLSTVMMNVIPAAIAGVEGIIMATPAGRDGRVKGSVLVAADLLGVKEIYKIGGAQAIAALCYGTESIPRVEKIVGPGNIYVALAKRRVTGLVGIDLIAGPSEVVILADKTASPKYIAADLIAQAEHDARAAAILITDSRDLGERVREQLDGQLKKLEREARARGSLLDYGAIIVVKDIDEGIAIVNRLAPEHLEIMTMSPMEDCKRIKNAGAIFLGEYSPEAVGDYYAGTNHILPTSGTARFSSPLGVYDFIKRTSLLYYPKDVLTKAGADIIKLATEESLTGHANSIKVRLEEENEKS